MNEKRLALACLTAGTLLLALGRSAQAQENKKLIGGPRPGVKERLDGVEKFLNVRTDESIQRFVDEQLSPALRSTKTPAQWTAELKEIRRLYQGFGTIRLAPSGESGLAVSFGGCPGEGIPLLLQVDPAAPYFITSLEIGGRTSESGPKKPDPSTPALTWDNLRERLQAEEADGFSGSVLVVHDGAVVLHEGYGLADRDKTVPNRPETVFAIGSTPIDFTKGAILKLVDLGKLKTSDSITKFLPNVPEDKKTMTIDHLMTGRSGLPNFLGSPEDADPDNTWIDRETALQRILGAELLFTPGTDRAHSHAAFGLLAAIIEMVSGDSYVGFLDKQLFGPAGMTNTRHYEDIRAKDDDVAIGYGGDDYAAVNSPKNWGKTSWLVLGSGGMVSTTGDLFRWTKGIRDGKLLSPESAKRYWAQSGGMLVGGNMHGFYTAYATGSESSFFLCTNVIGREKTEPLAEALAGLVNKPKFRLGVSLRVESDGLVIDAVQPDSPAQRGGLKSGDRLIAVNGQSLESESGGDLLRQQLATGKPVELKIKRVDQTLTMTLSPGPG